LLGRSVGGDAAVAPPLVLGVGEVETAGGAGRDGDDPPATAGLERGEKQRGGRCGPSTLVAQWRSNPSGVTSRAGKEAAALLTSTSSLANRSWKTAAKSRTDAGEERSIPMTVTDVAAVLLTIACLATSPRGVLRQPRITSAPMRASSRAVSLPMPLLAPVMSATRAERSTSSGFIALRLPWR
jgi:hypothetical protein